LTGAAIFSPFHPFTFSSFHLFTFSPFHPFTLSPFHPFIFSSFRLCITDCADYAKMWLKEAIHDTEKDELAVA